jgi:type II secretory pathway predicted ATPase ExeA
MYEAFFGLAGKPFSTLPDPDCLFESSNHAAVFQTVARDLDAGIALCVITGPTGCGKTTLVQRLLRSLDDGVTVGLIPNTYRDLQDLPRWVLMSFDRKPSGNTPEAAADELMDFLAGEYAAGRRCLLIIDEAQNLARTVLEDLNRLCCVNADRRLLLLQILLVGQPELLENIRHPALADLAKRVSARHELNPLSLREVMLYIQRRLELVRAPRPLFDSLAIALIHFFSGGVPRLVNAVCDLSLLYAFAESRRLVDADIVQAVISDRKLTGLATFSNLERIEDPALIHDIRTRFDLSEAAPQPATEPQATLAATSDPAASDQPGPEREAPGEAPARTQAEGVPETAPLLTDVVYSAEISDIEPAGAPLDPLAATAAFDASNLYYLHPELSADWPEIPGRAEVMRTTQTRRHPEPLRFGKTSSRGSLRRRFLPRGDGQEL